MMSMPVDMERTQQRQCLAVLTQPVHLVLLPPPRISHPFGYLVLHNQHSNFKLQLMRSSIRCVTCVEVNCSGAAQQP